MHIAIHSIHLSDHNPGRSKTWLLSGHRVNKVNGLCPMCPTSMCQPQNKLAHHLCQSHRWCPHSNRGKSLGHPYSLICGIFWHTTPRRWPNMLWDECKWNVYIDESNEGSSKSPISSDSGQKFDSKIIPDESRASHKSPRRHEDRHHRQHPQQCLRLHLSKPVIAGPETRWPESFLNGNTADVSSFSLHRLCFFIGYRWSLFGIEVEKCINKCLVAEFKLCKLFFSSGIFQISGFPFLEYHKIKNPTLCKQGNTTSYGYWKSVGPSCLLMTSSISFPTLSTFIHLNSQALDSPWGPNICTKRDPQHWSDLNGT